MKRLLVGVAFGVVTAYSAGLLAQAPAPAGATDLHFDVASVKPSNPSPAGPLAAAPLIMPIGDRLTGQNLPLRFYIRLAYGVQDFQISGGDAWLTSQKYDINARFAEPPAGGFNQASLQQPLRELLEDRFKLRVHRETREGQGYSLVLARSDGRLGSSLTASMSDCSDADEQAKKRMEAFAKGGLQALATFMPKPGEAMKCAVAPSMATNADSPQAMFDSFKLHGDGQPMTTLVALLQQYSGRPVTDKTGLTGLYDWDLHFDIMALAQAQAQQFGIAIPPMPAMQTDAPPLTTAIQEQLGLKLQSDRVPIEMIVIDNAEMPLPD